jgi:hypothetical protein
MYELPPTTRFLPRDTTFRKVSVLSKVQVPCKETRGRASKLTGTLRHKRDLRLIEVLFLLKQTLGERKME